MVRETRHLWIGNLPHAIREDRILDHFKRYGKVQSIKILPKKEEEGGGSCATVAFIDIKSASKAHNAENKIDERTLKTDYYEPPASSTASSAIFIHERDDALVVRNSAPPPPPAAYATSRNARYGLPEERSYERPPAHYYDRVTDREPYMRRPVGMGYHEEDSYQGRAKSRDRYVRSASGNNYTEGTERNQNHFRTHNTRQLFEPARYSEQYNDERDVGSTAPRINRRTNNASSASVVSSAASSPPPSTRSESRHRRNKRRSPSHSPSASQSRSRSRSRSTSGSRSSSSSSKLRSSSSDSSGRSWSPSKSRSPVTSYGSQSNAKRLDRPTSAVATPSTMTSSYMLTSITSSTVNSTSSISNCQSFITTQCSTPLTPNDSIPDKEEKKPLGICVRNLPVRSTDTSLKDGLFHEYKKHGKVTMVKVIGQGTDRYAVVCFKKPEDVEKALEVSKDKQFFGCKIEVTAHEGLDADDNEFRPLEAELDEYHPKATRTLFIGNLEKEVTTTELRKHFEQFGEIIEIDIKKQGTATSYAFIQYSDITSVVKAMRKLDGENLGANRIKLGFGKSMPTNCVWLDGIADTISEKYLARHFTRFGLVTYCAVDWEKGHALVFYDNVEFAQIAVAEMRGRILGGKKLQVDFASRECQTTFFDKLEMNGQMVPGERPWERRDRRGTEFDIVRTDDRDTRVGFDRVYPRYDGQTRTNRGNFRGIQRTAFSGRGRAQTFPNRYEMYYDEFGERRYRFGGPREENANENSTFDGKSDRLKYNDPMDCNNRKRNKLRNSISDQESHHSQSPPRSRHQSRSTSPLPKERKSLKDRLHHRIKSPGSHNSSQMSSPCRESATEELPDGDYKDFRLKNCDSKPELCDTDATFPLASPKNCSIHEGSERNHPKVDGDLSRRKSLDSDNLDDTITSEQLSQLERKRRLLVAAAALSKDSNMLTPRTSDRFKLKNSSSHSVKSGQNNCESGDDKTDGEGHAAGEDGLKEKPREGTDLKYLQKKQVHLLHLLEQLHEGVNSSDTEGSVDGDKYGRKKRRSLSSCVETLYNDSDIAKAVAKDECNLRLLKNSLKNHLSMTKSLNKTESVDSNNCLSLDSFVFRKHLDPRNPLSSLSKSRRISADKEDLLSEIQEGDAFIDIAWKKDALFANSDDVNSFLHGKDETGDVRLSKKLLSMRPFSSDEGKRDRDVSPLSLPLPKFAATLRSPKSSPSTLTSPKSVAQSPQALHSPNPHGRNLKVTDILTDINHERKVIPEEKVNGTNLSSSASSPSESPSLPEISPETIQSPKDTSERPKEVTLSSDSEDLTPVSSPNRPSIEDRIKALDERFNAWSGSARTPGVNGPGNSPTAIVDLPKCNIKRSRFNFLASDLRTEPSEIVKSLLSKSTIFDQDSMRLQHIDEKYEPTSAKNELQKSKPTFRTKAAAKEFSVPPAQTTTTFNTTVHSKPMTPSEVLPSAISNAILSPITPPTPHFSQVPSQLYAPCSPCIASFPAMGETAEPSLSSNQSLSGEQSGLATSTFCITKVKAEHAETLTHTHLPNSLPISVKKEQVTLASETIAPVFTETEKFSMKKDLPTPVKTNIPLVKDLPSTVLKDHVVKKLETKDTSTLRQHSSHWCNDLDMVEDVPIKPNVNCTDTKLVGKKRVSSIDSTESESGKSFKSLEMVREHQDPPWLKHEKESSRLLEPECKKLKTSLSQGDLNSLPTYRKNEKKEKLMKPRSNSSVTNNPKKTQSLDKEDSDVKNLKTDLRDKPKSDSHKLKDEKKSKSHDHKESSSNKHEQKSKPSEKKNFERDNRNSSSSNPKNKKESSSSTNSSKSEKSKVEKKPTEKKSTSSSSKGKSKVDKEIFIIPPDTEPVYFSMYDKVKARSNKQQTMKHQAKDLETMRQKFSKLKQSRAKREEKSKSLDSDKDSDSASQHSSDSESRTSAKTAKQQRKRKLIIESSSDDDIPQNTQNRISRNDSKDFSNSASDSDSDHKPHPRQLHNNRGRKKKADVIHSDSSDSDSQLPPPKLEVNKKKVKSKSVPPEKSRKNLKSEGEISDVEMTDKSITKDKDYKRKKLKKTTKTHDMKSEREQTNTTLHRKNSDETKTLRKKPHKEERSFLDAPTKHEEVVKDKFDIVSREKRIDHHTAPSEVEESDKYRTFVKKKKKSKKTSRSKDKKIPTDRRSSEFTNREGSESKSSLPVLLSPRASSLSNDKPSSPPCLKAGDISDCDMKSDFSDDDIFSSHHLKTNRNSISLDRSRTENKVENSSDFKGSKMVKKKERIHSPTKVHHDPFDSILASLPEKLSKSSQEKEVFGKSHANDGRKKISSSSIKSKTKEFSSSHQKTKHEKSEDTCNKYNDCKPFGIDNSHSKDDKRKKIKKPIKEIKIEKKPKPKIEEMKDIENNPSLNALSSPLTFESVSLDDSCLSDIRLDEEIAKEARRLEQELLAVSEETSTFGDEGPATKKEEKLAVRKFEEEAAKETMRLEAELFSTGRECWHIKEKSFSPELHSEELCSGDKDSVDGNLVMKEESLFATLALQSSLCDTSQHDNDLFLANHSDSDQYKLGDKDAVSELDDQRKIEDDLAVSALLQEMNNGDISAPDLTKEGNYLDPLLGTQPDDTMNYLLPDESDNSLQIVDQSPELLVNETSEARLDVLPPSPSSNSEPPPLEISTFEDRVDVKTFQESKPAEVETPKSEPVCETFHSNKSVIASRHIVNLETSSLLEKSIKNKPPVISIASRTSPDSISSRSVRFQEKQWTSDTSPNKRLTKDSVLHSVCSNGSGQLNVNPVNFEDITMDTKESKEDDNPPVLLPVNLQPRIDSTIDTVVKTQTVLASPTSRSKNIITPVSVPLSTESVIVRAPEVEKAQESILTTKSNTESDSLRLSNFNEPCDILTPMNTSFCRDSTKTPTLKLSSDAFKSIPANERSSDNRIGFNPKPLSESSLWGSSVSQLKPPVTVNQDPTQIKSPVLYYQNLFNQKENSTIDSRFEDTSVIKSTAAITGGNLLEKSTKTPGESTESYNSFLPKVFSPNPDSRGVVIFNTSQLPKPKESPAIQPPMYDFNQKYSLQTMTETFIPKKEKSPEKQVAKEIETTKSDPFDKLQKSKPPDLHFPPLFTIPTTEPLMSPKKDKPTAIESDKEKQKEEEIKPPIISLEKTTDEIKPPKEAVSSKVDVPKVESEPESISSLAETLTKIEEKLQEEETAQKKATAVDVESVSSDTTDITYPDIKTDMEMSQLTSSEEQAKEDVEQAEESPVVGKQKSERPRRGRRGKGRKSTDSKQEISADVVPTVKGKRVRPTSFERSRRSLRSDGVLKRSVTDSNESKNDILSKVEEEKTEEDLHDVNVPQNETLTSSNKDLDTKHNDKAYNTRAEESKKRRGRKKKSSGEHQNQSKADGKTDNQELSKDFHSHKDRLWHVWLASEKEQKTSVAESKDIYEFCDEEEETTTTVKDRLHNTPRAGCQESKSTESSPEKTEEPKQKVIEDIETPTISINKEPAPEQTTKNIDHPKISELKIKIRFKDGRDGSSATAEVIKNSDLQPAEDVKQESTKVDENKDQSSDTSSGPSKSTRKSARLANQAARTATEPTPSRVRRRSRANRKSEENSLNVSSDIFEDPTEDKSMSEPVFVIPDNTVKDLPEVKKSVGEASISETNSSAEPDRNEKVAILRSFRLSHSTPNKADGQKTNHSSSELSHDSDSQKAEILPDKKDISHKESSKRDTPEAVPSVPTLKVEKMIISTGKDSSTQKVITKSSEEVEEDNDSRSSHAGLVDPFTGIVAPVSKTNDEAPEKFENTFQSAEPKSPTSQPSISKPVSSSKSVAKESGKEDWIESQKPIIREPHGQPIITSATTDSQSYGSSIVNDIGAADLSLSKAHASDHKPSDIKAKIYAHAGVSTPVVSPTSTLPVPPKLSDPVISPNSQPQLHTPSSGKPSYMREALRMSGMQNAPGSNVPTSVHQQQPPPPPVKTVVVPPAINPSETVTNLPLKIQAKNLANSVANKASIMIPRNEISPLHISVKSPTTSSAIPKSDALPSPQHTSLAKEETNASPVVGGNNTWSDPKPNPTASPHLNIIQGSSSHTSISKSESHIGQPAHAHPSKNSLAYCPPVGFPTSMYDAAAKLQSLGPNYNSSAIAEILQNPQLLQQQRKEYHAVKAASSAQFQDRNPNQLVRPPTPVNSAISESAARLHNPASPHPPAPYGSASSHLLQQPQDIHGSHVVSGLRVRQTPFMPGWEPVTPYQFVFPMPMYTEFQAHEAARAAISLPPHHFLIPQSSVSPGNFRPSMDSHLPHSDHKRDGKMPVEMVDDRRTPDDKALHAMKSSRSKKKEDKEMKMGHHDDHERPGSGHDKHAIVPPGRLRQDHIHYQSIRMPNAHERTTDSPYIGSMYGSVPGRPLSVSEQMKEHPQDSPLALHQSHLVKGDGSERELNPPIAHQSHVPYRAVDGSFHVRQPPMGVVSSAGGYVNDRSSVPPAHTPNSYHCNKQMYESAPKNVIDRLMVPQGSTVSPGMGSMPVIQSHNTHHSQSPYPSVPPNEHPMNSHVSPMGSESLKAPMHQSMEPSPQNDILVKHPIIWQGKLAIKNETASVQMHLVKGNSGVAEKSLPEETLKIVQRMKLDEPQLDGVTNKMKIDSEHCILVALPCGTSNKDVLVQSNKLQNAFINYLQQKTAAGICNGSTDSSKSYIIHIFPPNISFSKGILNEHADVLATVISDITHLVIVITPM